MPGPPADVKAVPVDQHSVLVSWLVPANPNGQLTQFAVYMKTMEQGRQFTQHFEVYPPETFFLVRGLNQNQPYSFWVRASTLIGYGPESGIVSETPQTPVPATLASFSSRVTRAVKEDVVLECRAVGQPRPVLTWRFG